MKIEELKQKHSAIPEGLLCSADIHARLSVKFAIEMLEDVQFLSPYSAEEYHRFLINKIAELKNYYK